MEINNQVQGSFRKVNCINLIPQLPRFTIDGPKISAESVVKLRKKQERLRNGLVIVVPYVIQGDFHKELKDYLHKKVKRKHICNQEIISQPETEEWIKAVIEGGMDQFKTHR